MSFKMLAFKEIYPFIGDETDPVHWFLGQIVVASSVALFPGVKFYCRRASESYRVGILKYDDANNEEALSFITCPSFDQPVIS